MQHFVNVIHTFTINWTNLLTDGERFIKAIIKYVVQTQALCFIDTIKVYKYLHGLY